MAPFGISELLMIEILPKISGCVATSTKGGLMHYKPAPDLCYSKYHTFNYT